MKAPNSSVTTCAAAGRGREHVKRQIQPTLNQPLNEGHLIDLQPNRHGRLHGIADKGNRGQKYPEVRVGAAIMHQIRHIHAAVQSA
jgi:hypothetical protein